MPACALLLALALPWPAAATAPAIEMAATLARLLWEGLQSRLPEGGFGNAPLVRMRVLSAMPRAGGGAVLRELRPWWSGAD